MLYCERNSAKATLTKTISQLKRQIINDAMQLLIRCDETTIVCGSGDSRDADNCDPSIIFWNFHYQNLLMLSG